MVGCLYFDEGLRLKTLVVRMRMYELLQWDLNSLARISKHVTFYAKKGGIVSRKTVTLITMLAKPSATRPFTKMIRCANDYNGTADLFAGAVTRIWCCLYFVKACLGPKREKETFKFTISFLQEKIKSRLPPCRRTTAMEGRGFLLLCGKSCLNLLYLNF